MTLDALKMGNYGAYVWSSYGLTVLALIWMAYAARRASQRELQQVTRRTAMSAMNSPETHEGAQS